MKKFFPIIILVIAVLIVLGGVIESRNDSDQPRTSDTEHMSTKMESTQKSDEKPKENEVFIRDFAFGPDTLTIKKGATITWTNKDEAHHDITPLETNDNFKASKLLAQGESYSYTFETVGSYNYKCSPHPYMKGKVVVTE